jgi:transposase
LKLEMDHSQLYPCDLSDAQATVLQPLVLRPARRGRKPTPWRRVLNAIFYCLRTGGAWRYLPKHYPPWPTVYGWYRCWQRTGIWQQIHDELRARVRVQAGKVGGVAVGAAAVAEDSVDDRAAVGRESVCGVAETLAGGTDVGVVVEMAAAAVRLRTAHRSQRSVHLHRHDWRDVTPPRQQKLNFKTRSNTTAEALAFPPSMRAT